MEKESTKKMTREDALLDWTSEFAGQWEDDRTADEVIEDIRGARTSNREIQQ